MAYPISTMIGIRTGGILSGSVDLDDLKKRILNIVEKLKEEDSLCGVYDGSISTELSGFKGSYVIIAGVFNYWDYNRTSKFGKILSKEFGAEVMVMTWDEQNDEIQCDVFLDGESINEINENPISTIFRRLE